MRKQMRELTLFFIIFFVIIFLLVSCKTGVNRDNNDNSNENNGDNNDVIPTDLIRPADLVYRGAFRMPAGTSDMKSWQWGGHAMTYYPLGEPAGAADGYPGSIFGAGHGWQHQVSEFSIPVPKISSGKNRGELNTAATLQAFRDILGVSNLEIPRTGLEYLPKQGSQTSAKLYFCWGYHMQDEQPDLTHGCCELNLANPEIQKGWFLADQPFHIRNMSANDYLFEIPANWAEAHVPGMRLATGRFRDGGWSGQGPSIFAIGPWNQGYPPASGTALQNTPLLLYTSTYDYTEGDNNYTIDNYHHSDEWTGGAWLTAGDKAAVIFAGTKGTGECWYGNQNGPCLDCEDRGWWSTGFKGQIIFYKPADLAEVAAGNMAPYEPQPYAALDIDEYLYNVKSTQQKEHVNAICFDRARGLLYIFENLADGDKPLVHVWKIE
jgi:hypothetical protein